MNKADSHPKTCSRANVLHPEAPAQGISAVKALAIASAQGQKIWTISQNNLETAMAALQLDADSKAEIRAGVLAGNVVTAHEKPINFNGWVGEGYTIIDPQTGAGAYKIAGGGNGAIVVVGYALSYLSYIVNIFYSYAHLFGTVFKPLDSFINLLELLKFIHEIAKSGFHECRANMGGFLWGVTLIAFVSLMISGFITFIVNPMAGFLVGTILDQGTSWLKDQANQCRQ